MHDGNPTPQLSLPELLGHCTCLDGKADKHHEDGVHIHVKCGRIFDEQARAQDEKLQARLKRKKQMRRRPARAM